MGQVTSPTRQSGNSGGPVMGGINITLGKVEIIPPGIQSLAMGTPTPAAVKRLTETLKLAHSVLVNLYVSGRTTASITLNVISAIEDAVPGLTRPDYFSPRSTRESTVTRSGSSNSGSGEDVSSLIE